MRHYLPLLLILAACRVRAGEVPAEFKATDEFNAYWNSGLAELDRYELTQARYGTLHKGEMIAIFVTEPFRTDKQVKSELTPGQNDTNVLKVHLTRRFATGIYDYMLTTSVFKPLETARFPRAPKISGSAVDWCGHSWLQLNLRGEKYGVQVRSYFEEFSDEDYAIPPALAEDEIWNRIRMYGDNLPRGEFAMIPSLVSQRLRHKRAAELKATAELKNAEDGNFEYALTFAAPESRKVVFVFEKRFPHKIREYRETYRDGFIIPRDLTTVARLKKTIRSAYWREHDPDHLRLRKEFGVGGY